MKTVAVIFGGRSTEHDVSIITAIASIIKPLELAGRYHVLAVYITRDGAWYCDERFKDVSVFTSGRIDTLLKQLKPVQLGLDGGMSLSVPGRLGKAKIHRLDVVFPSMHGTYGEDGSLMGLLDMAGVAYVGCGLSASVLAMDKVLAKIVAASSGIATADFLHFSRSDVQTGLDAAVNAVKKQLKFPLFIKPAHLGSSIGISRAKDESELRNALEVAAYYDDSIIVEVAVQNLIEVTLPVMGNDTPVPALLEQPLVNAEDFFDFDTKYMHGGKKGGKKGGGKSAQGYSKLPAELPKALYEKAKATGLAVYKALGCSGTARVDMLIDEKTGDVYFNEVNPMPGSLYAHNWRAAGVPPVDLVEKLIGYAEERHQYLQSLTTKFDTNYLKQF